VIGLEEDVPYREVSVVLSMVLILVVHPMGFGSLKPRTKPVRGFDIPVVEVFRDCRQKGVNRCRLDGDPENEIGKGR